MLNRFLSIPPCLKRLRSSNGPSLAPNTSKTSSYVVQTQLSSSISRTTASYQLHPNLTEGVEPPLSLIHPLDAEPVTDTTSHIPSAQSRALDPADDEFHKEVADRQRRPESGSRHSLHRCFQSSAPLVCRYSTALGRRTIPRRVSGDTNGHNQSAESRALDPADDEFYGKDGYGQRRLESGSQHSSLPLIRKHFSRLGHPITTRTASRDTNSHNQSAESRALDPADDEFHEKVNYGKRRLKSGSQHSSAPLVCRYYTALGRRTIPRRVSGDTNGHNQSVESRALDPADDEFHGKDGYGQRRLESGSQHSSVLLTRYYFKRLDLRITTRIASSDTNSHNQSSESRALDPADEEFHEKADYGQIRLESGSQHSSVPLIRKHFSWLGHPITPRIASSDTNSHNQSSESRALDPADEEFHEKVDYGQRRLETGSQHSSSVLLIRHYFNFRRLDDIIMLHLRITTRIASSDTNSHNQSAESRALDPADDEFHEKADYGQIRLESGFQHFSVSLTRYYFKGVDLRITTQIASSDTNSHNQSAETRALGPPDDEFHEKADYGQIRLESGSQHSSVPLIRKHFSWLGHPITPRIASSDANGHNQSAKSRALDPADDDFHGKVDYRQRRFVSLRPLRKSRGNHDDHHDLDKFSRSWSMRYAVIHERRQTIEIRPSSFVKTSILSAVDMRMHLQRLLDYSPNARFREWENYLLLNLQFTPENAMMVLDVALSPSHSILPFPKHTIDDSLDHLTGIYLQNVESPSSLKVDMMHRIVCNLAKRPRLEDSQTNFIPPKTMYWTLRHSQNDQAVSLYKALREANIHIQPRILLCFLERFVQIREIPFFLEVLQNIAASGLSLPPLADHSKFTKPVRALIRCKGEDQDSMNLYRMRKHILSQILQVGIRLDITAYTAIIQNAVEAQEYRSALRFYQMARECGLKPNGVTYAILLDAAMQKLDYDILDMVVWDAEADHTLYGDEGLIFKLLCAELELEKNIGEPFLFNAILRTYKKYCDPRPIQDLGLCEPDVNPPETSIHPLFSPSPRMLGFMLVMYIKQYHYHDELLNIYQRYYRFVEERHPTIAAIEQTDHVSNAFIYAFGQREQTLPMAIDIVRKMLQNAAHSNTTDPTTSMSFNFAAPTVRTWSILAMVHARHGQAKAAEKILGVMRERGLNPNQATWNGLVSAYSALQWIDVAVATVNRMERDGNQMDSYTLKGLGRFINRDRLLQALREGLVVGD